MQLLNPRPRIGGDSSCGQINRLKAESNTGEPPQPERENSPRPSTARSRFWCPLRCHGTNDRNLKNAKPTTRPNLPWRYWKTPVLFGAGLCILQILVAIVRFAGREGWNPAILFEIPAILLGLAMFFLCGLMVGLLVQRLLKGRTGAWRTVLMVGVVLATPFAVLFSLFGGLLGPPVVLIGTLVPVLSS